jgi:uncharacterized protein YicC (UPF0701 family)
MVDSFEDFVRTSGIADALNEIAPAVRQAEALHKMHHVLQVLRGAVQNGAELDAALKKRRDELAALTDKILQDAKAEGVRQRDQILARAREDAQSILDEATARSVAIDNEIAAKHGELDKLNQHVEEMKTRLRGALS